MAPKSAAARPLVLAERAFRLFARKGIRNVNLDSVGAAAGVTKGSLYWHFRSKRDLILAACEHYYRCYHERMLTEIANNSDPMVRLERILRLNVRICLLDAENRNFTLEILTLSVHDKAVRRSWLEFYERVRAQYVDLILALRPGGPAARRQAGRTANSLLESFEGVKLRTLFEPVICTDPAEEDRIVQNLLAIAGLSAPASATKLR